MAVALALKAPSRYKNKQCEKATGFGKRFQSPLLFIVKLQFRKRSAAELVS
jgi:hypothetical protein